MAVAFFHDTVAMKLSLQIAVLAALLSTSPTQARVCRPLPPGIEIYFSPSTVEMTSRGWVASTLDRMANAPQGATVSVTGHVANQGDAQSQFDLSRRRALVVAEAMVSAGIREDLIIVRWRGAADARPTMADRVTLEYSYTPPPNCPVPLVEERGH